MSKIEKNSRKFLKQKLSTSDNQFLSRYISLRIAIAFYGELLQHDINFRQTLIIDSISFELQIQLY